MLLPPSPCSACRTLPSLSGRRRCSFPIHSQALIATWTISSCPEYDPTRLRPHTQALLRAASLRIGTPARAAMSALRETHPSKQLQHPCTRRADKVFGMPNTNPVPPCASGTEQIGTAPLIKPPTAFPSDNTSVRRYPLDDVKPPTFPRLVNEASVCSACRTLPGFQ